MTRIESPSVRVAASPATVAQDFQQWDTFGELLSAGPVSDFKAEGDKCSFKVTGGVAVHLVRTSDNSASEGTVLTLATEAPTPVKFTLDVAVQAEGDGATPLFFASKMGQLAGNHFITLTSGLENLATLGKSVLWKGAQPIRFEEV